MSFCRDYVITWLAPRMHAPSIFQVQKAIRVRETFPAVCSVNPSMHVTCKDGGQSQREKNWERTGRTAAPVGTPSRWPC
jgi:hypothetical protein